MSNLVERIKQRIDANKTCLRNAEIANINESMKYFQNLIFEDNTILSFVEEESSKEPQSSESDLISRKKLIEDIQLIAKELNKDKQNAESDDSDLMLAVDNQLSAIWRIKGVINNQPQVQPTCFGCTYDYEHSYLDARLKADGWTKQPIVRSAEEIADEVEKVCLTIQGYNKPKELQFAMFDKKDFIDWLLGKEV